MSNFREVFLSVHMDRMADEPMTARDAIHRIRNTTERSHRRLWWALENHVAHVYEKETGTVLPETIDWTTFREWLSEHWMQILQCVIGIISLFSLLSLPPKASAPVSGLLPDLSHFNDAADAVKAAVTDASVLFLAMQKLLADWRVAGAITLTLQLPKEQP
jgi:hypothetical protein